MGVHPLRVSKLLLGFTGHARRSWLRALQTSKVSSAPSCFTCPVAVDATTREVLPSVLQVRSSGRVPPKCPLRCWPSPHWPHAQTNLSPVFCAPAEPVEPPGTPPASQGHLDAALPTVVHCKGNTQLWANGRER